jgi:diguanylate cyclase (GGDEF)-like protein
LIRAITRHPWSSVQDGLLIAGVMLVATLLALEYDLFKWVAELSEPQRRISLAEAIFLTLLLAACLIAFVVRRLREERRDVAQRVAAKLELRELKVLASQDPLTGLANRRVLEAALTAAATSPRSGGRKHVFFLIDLNHFKRINDRYGHALGDRILQVVTGRFKSVTRPSDLLARLGGDEFGILSYRVDQDTAYEIGLRFIAALEPELRVGGRSHHVGVSIGAATIPDDGTTPEEILRNADLAMYSAKRQDGCSSLAFFEPTADYPQQIASS